MPNYDLENSKLALEVKSLEAGLTKATQEAHKLSLEVDLLRSQIGGWGTFTRIAWPIISVILSTVIAGMAVIFTVRSHNDDSRQKGSELDQEKSVTELSSIHDAGDESKGNDARISAIWLLNPFFENSKDRRFFASAHTLVTALVTGEDDEDINKAYSKQAVRIAAAEVLGRVSPCEPNQSDVVKDVKNLLFSPVGHTDTPGLISIEESLLVIHRQVLNSRPQPKTSGADMKLSAIRFVVERYRDCLDQTDLHAFDLRSIDFSSAHLHEANLAGSDLRGANLDSADLSGADLTSSRLADSLNWNKIYVDRANINSLENAPPGFRDWALDQHAVEMDPPAWKSYNSKSRQLPRDWAKWRQSGFPLNDSGIPTQ
jgi:hypothetical protein